jgi:hypothetical protein
MPSVLCSSRNIREQISHPYKTKGKIYIFLLVFLYFLGTKALTVLFLLYVVRKAMGPVETYRSSTYPWSLHVGPVTVAMTEMAGECAEGEEGAGGWAMWW